MDDPGFQGVTELPQTMNIYYWHEFLPVASDWSIRCELIVTAARPSLPSPKRPVIRWDGLASQTKLAVEQTLGE